MQKNKLIIISLLFHLTSVYTYSQGISNYSPPKNDSLSVYKCISLLSQGRDYWINDSLGKTGYRYLLAFEFLRKCSFVNIKWDQISYFFGKAGFVSEKGNMIRYKYILSRDYFLEINITDGIITKSEIGLY
jgi:hypothetical protein